jgi:hypothetical protein
MVTGTFPEGGSLPSPPKKIPAEVLVVFVALIVQMKVILTKQEEAILVEYID